MMRIAQHLQALSLAALVVAPSCSSGGTGAPEESTSATATTTTTTTTTTSSPAPDQAAGEPDGPAPDAAELRADPVTGELVGWILDHPDDVSVVVSDVGEAPAVAWNGGTARPIASTFKTIVLAAYAREVAAGRLDPDEVVPLRDIDRWLIEGSDGGSHDLMIDAYGTADGVRLDDLAAAMTAFSTNTATDVLLARIGRPAVEQTARELGLPDLAPAAAPPAGALTMVSDDALGATVDERLAAALDLDQDRADAAAWDRAAALVAAPAVRAGATLAALGELTSWEQQLLLTRALPWRARPIDLHQLLVAVLADGQLGEPAAAIVAGHLSWPLEDPVIAGRFALLAAKEGEAPGSLVAVALGRPSTGPAAGTDRAVVVALQEMDAGTWAAASEGARYQALALRLLDDPAFVAALGEALVP